MKAQLIAITPDEAKTLFNSIALLEKGIEDAYSSGQIHGDKNKEFQLHLQNAKLIKSAINHAFNGSRKFYTPMKKA